METKKKFCTTCGTEIHVNAEICPNCGVRQNPAPPIVVTQPKKKGLPKWVIAIIVILFLGVLGNIMNNDSTPGSSTSTGSRSTTPEYEWVEIKSYPFDTEGKFAEWILTEIMPEYTIPNNAVAMKVTVNFSGGDKDSYVKITVWRWGQEDDINIKTFFKNAKEGSEEWIYKDVNKGRRYYIEFSSILKLEGVCKVYVQVPK